MKIDNWKFWICFLVQKWPFRDAHLFFKNWFADWGCTLFGPRCQKRENLDTPKNKILTDNWVFWFLLFLFFFVFYVFVFSESLRVR